jgi:hypothetical protein
MMHLLFVVVMLDVTLQRHTITLHTHTCPDTYVRACVFSSTLDKYTIFVYEK